MATLRATAQGTTTVQLLPHHLADAELELAVGQVIEAAPTMYVESHAGASGPDRRDGDELGTLEAVGTMLAAPLPTSDECGCRVDVLDCEGDLIPLNWAGTVPAPAGPVAVDAEPRLWVAGALYLEPALEPGTEHGDAVALCRRRYRVGALRCYHRAPGAGIPRPLGPLRATPDPGRVSTERVYVADLVPDGRGIGS